VPCEKTNGNATESTTFVGICKTQLEWEEKKNPPSACRRADWEDRGRPSDISVGRTAARDAKMTNRIARRNQGQVMEGCGSEIPQSSSYNLPFSTNEGKWGVWRETKGEEGVTRVYVCFVVKKSENLKKEIKRRDKDISVR